MASKFEVHTFQRDTDHGLVVGRILIFTSADEAVNAIDSMSPAVAGAIALQFQREDKGSLQMVLGLKRSGEIPDGYTKWLVER